MLIKFFVLPCGWSESELIEIAAKKPKAELEYFSPLKAPACIGSSYT